MEEALITHWFRMEDMTHQHLAMTANAKRTPVEFLEYIKCSQTLLQCLHQENKTNTP